MKKKPIRKDVNSSDPENLIANILEKTPEHTEVTNGVLSQSEIDALLNAVSCINTANISKERPNLIHKVRTDICDAFRRLSVVAIKESPNELEKDVLYIMELLLRAKTNIDSHIKHDSNETGAK